MLAGRGEQSPVLSEFRQTALARQASFGYGHRQADSELRLKMSDANKIVAATFAVARCGGLGHGKPEDYIAEYDIFLRLLNEREATAERAEQEVWADRLATRHPAPSAFTRSQCRPFLVVAVRQSGGQMSSA